MPVIGVLHPVNLNYNIAMANHPANRKRNVWEQWDWVWHIIAYVSLGLNIVFTVGGNPHTHWLLLFLGLSALLALWYLPFIAKPLTYWRDRSLLSVLYLIAGWVLWAGLLALDERALLLGGMFYPLIFSRFPVRWAIPVALSQTLGLFLFYVFFHSPENWFAPLMIALGLLFGAILIGVFIAALINQSVERQRLLDELTQTRASLLKTEREKGVLTERQRLAREIHDTLAQQFTSIIMHLAAARLSDPAAIQTHVEQAEQTAREGLDEARRMIWDMRPEQLEHASLVESIEGLAARWSVENAIDLSISVTGDPQPLTSSTDVALLRIAQEALQNIKKHARAQHVNITLSYMPDVLVLDVADDGQGFDPASNGRGFGLKSMRERAEELGGEFAVESEIGTGAKIAVLIPISEMD